MGKRTRAQSSALGAAVLFGIVALLFVPAAAADAQQRVKPAPARPRGEGEGPFEKLIIRGATLIDGTGAPPRGPVDIVIERNRITQIVDVGFPNVPIDSAQRPKGATKEIDAHGMYVMPGFIDLHLHTGEVPKAPEAEYVYKLWMAHGVTFGSRRRLRTAGLVGLRESAQREERDHGPAHVRLRCA